MVPGAGIEPALLSEGDFESPASTNFTTRAGICEAANYGTVARMSTMKYPTIEDAVGRTPLVALQRIGAEANAARGNVVLGKLEGNNPAGSVKDRPSWRSPSPLPPTTCSATCCCRLCWSGCEARHRACGCTSFRPTFPRPACCATAIASWC